MTQGPNTNGSVIKGLLTDLGHAGAEFWRWFWKQSWKVKGPSLAGLALVFLIIIGSAADDESANIAQAEPKGGATLAIGAATAKPIGTPSPTATPAPPTAVPTADPEIGYRAAILVHSTALGGYMGQFQPLMQAANFTSASWRQSVDSLVDNVTAEAAAMRDLTSPSTRFDAFERKKDQAMDAYIASMTLLKSGVRNSNANTIIDATAKLSEATGLLNQANGLIPK